MNLLKVIGFGKFFGLGGSGGGGEAADVAFLDLKKTITEYRDDTIVKLPECAFYGCTNLKMVVLPKVDSIMGQELFAGCDNLVVVDFTALKKLSAGYMYEDYYPRPVPDTTKALVNRGGLFQMGNYDNQYDCDGLGWSTSDMIVGDTYFYIPREYIKEENFAGTTEDDYWYDYPNGADWDYIWKYEPERIRAIEDYTVDGTVTGALDLKKMGIE